MATLDETTRSANYDGGWVIVHLNDGLEIRFPVAKNPRLARGTVEQLRHIEISPFGLHWPELDEDLSFNGLALGDYGQGSKHGGKSGATVSS